MPIAKLMALDFIKNIIKGTKFENNVFLAGGAVRDEVMNKIPKDIDLMINLPDGGIEFAKSITVVSGCYNEGTNPVIFPKFGTAKFNLRGVTHRGYDLSNVDIECVMPRVETYEFGNRKPEVALGTLRDDVLRRDFTINTLLKNLSTGEILDLTKRGLEDIIYKGITTPLHPNNTFKEDPLRMLRAIRFVCKLGFEMVPSVYSAIKENNNMLSYISVERINDEFSKMLVTDQPRKAIEMLIDTGMINYIIHELNDAKGMEQNEHHDYDVLEHSIRVMENTQPILVNRLAGLLHDIGKPKVRVQDDKGVYHFYGHADAGAEMAKEILYRLKYSTEVVDAVCLIIKEHMRLKQSGNLCENISDSAIRRFRVTAGNNLDAFLDIMHADNISHGVLKDMPYQVPMLRSRIERLNFTYKVKPQLPINGHDIMETFGIPQGERVGALLKVVELMWYENPEVSKWEVIEELRDHWINKSEEN